MERIGFVLLLLAPSFFLSLCWRVLLSSTDGSGSEKLSVMGW